jgi:hypothetical protein
MPVMLERWNDDRMDALGAKVDDMDVRLARVEVRVDEGFRKVDTELREQRQAMKAGFDCVDERFERMQLLLVQLCGAIIVALIGLIATQL